MSRLLRPDDYRVMPWKNGLGSTTEIAVAPEGAGLDDFAWRVSIADLAAPGPFSIFAGCDRVLVQIEGEPMTLVHDGAERVTLAWLAPHRFAGERATYGELASPARDFNVMVRRDRASAEVVTAALAEGEALRAPSAETTLAHVLRGAASIEVAGVRSAVRAGETLVTAARGPCTAIATSGGAVVIIAAIGPPGTFTGG